VPATGRRWQPADGTVGCRSPIGRRQGRRLSHPTRSAARLGGRPPRRRAVPYRSAGTRPVVEPRRRARRKRWPPADPPRNTLETCSKRWGKQKSRPGEAALRRGQTFGVCLNPSRVPPELPWRWIRGRPCCTPSKYRRWKRPWVVWSMTSLQTQRARRPCRSGSDPCRPTECPRPSPSLL
jgi:hypothetical protein